VVLASCKMICDPSLCSYCQETSQKRANVPPLIPRRSVVGLRICGARHYSISNILDKIPPFKLEPPPLHFIHIWPSIFSPKLFFAFKPSPPNFHYQSLSHGHPMVWVSLMLSPPTHLRRHTKSQVNKVHFLSLFGPL